MSEIWVVNSSPVIVLRARKKAIIPSAGVVLKALRLAGLYLDDILIRSALASIGEGWE